MEKGLGFLTNGYIDRNIGGEYLWEQIGSQASQSVRKMLF